MEQENCVGDTDCCRIIRKCDEELGEVAGKLDIRISISLPPKTTLLGTERILRKVLEFSSKESRSKGPFFMGYDSLP